MKIGKLTLDGYCNYGNVLQNYALRQVLLRYAEVVDSLWHEQDRFMVRTWHKWSWKEPVKYLINWRGFRDELLSDFHGMEMVRQGRIKEWCDRYIGIKRAADLSKITDDYDYFVVGSDQVWNPHFSDLEHCFLTFAPKEKRIAYAASISCPDIPEKDKPLFKQGLTEMAHISMREQAGADMVKSFSGREVPVVVDPTLLLTADEWRKVSRQPAWYHGEDYILTYFLGARPEVVEKLSQETGLPVVNILDRDVYEHYVISPDEFLWAIEHAKLLYTDSFHGTVFSIKYNKQFVTLIRKGVEQVYGNSEKLEDLLKTFNLGNRELTNVSDLEDKLLETIDYEPVNMKISSEKQKALDYLRKFVE